MSIHFLLCLFGLLLLGVRLESFFSLGSFVSLPLSLSLDLDLDRLARLFPSFTVTGVLK